MYTCKCGKRIRKYNKTCMKCKPQNQRCDKCGKILSSKTNIHDCSSVDLKPTRYCVTCNKELSNQGQERWNKECSRCGKIRWREFERQEKRKIRLEFGGCCQRCGYDKCEAALHFHHKDGRLDNKSGGVKLKELREHPQRFELICANCHIEEHQSHTLNWKT